MISCGDEVERLRNIASEVIRNLEHTFVFELGLELALREWDFRRDAPRVVEQGALAERSLTMVRGSDAVLVILGKGLPNVTQKEVREALSRLAHGDMDEVFVFLHKEDQTEEQRDFVSAAAAEVGRTVIWADYTDELSFQALTYGSLLKFVFRRVQGEVAGGS